LWWLHKRAAAEGVARALLKEATRLQQEEKWTEGISAIEHAKGVLAGVGADPDLRRQVEELGKDLEMVRRLEEARLQMTALKDGHFDYEASNAAYAEAFAWYGLDVENLDPRDAGQRIRSRSIRLQLTAAVDYWASMRRALGVGGLSQLVAVARAADPDPWRDQLRNVLEGKGTKTLEKLVASAKIDELAPGTLVLLSALANKTPAAESVVVLLRQAQQRHPGDFWINHQLAECLYASRFPQLEEAIRYYTAALALRPQSPGTHVNLGKALHAKGRLEEAVAESREAIRLKKDYAEAHHNLGVALKDKGRLDEAIAEFREAIAEFQEAICLKKDYAEAHMNLGLALVQKGQFREGVAELRHGDELGSRDPHWPHARAQAQLRQAEQLVRLDDRIADVLRGNGQPKDAAERLGFAQLCQQPSKRLYAAAARFYSDAFTAEPKLVGEKPSDHRYNAACAAALAGCGQGKDADAPDEKERARLRRQALDWLQADLAAWGKLLEKEPDKLRPVIQQQLQHWQEDSDFAGVRGLEALAKLPEVERQAWQKLWADVEKTLAKAREGKSALPTAPRPAGKK
jgi:serine/threonine-protein kinase